MRYLTIEKTHVVYFDEIHTSYHIAEMLTDEGRRSFVLLRGNHFIDMMDTRNFLGETLDQAIQELVRKLRIELDTPYISHSPDFEYAVKALAENYLSGRVIQKLGDSTGSPSRYDMIKGDAT